LVVTFDDAYRSVLRLGFPVLSELGVPGTVFVPTEYVTAQEPLAWPPMDEWIGGPHEAELECMSWDELRRLRDAGWEIASHSRSHPDLRSLDAVELAAELRGSREDCEQELQQACRSLAYPFSAYDKRVKEAARMSGYETAVTLDLQVALARRTSPTLPGPTDLFELSRAGIYRGDGWLRFLAKTSRFARRLRASVPLHKAANLANGSRARRSGGR
jgi:peptidoglycan/xylan/chitin deacetylase (PgdA/CDA1 family)